jgi:hypothetical protein
VSYCPYGTYSWPGSTVLSTETPVGPTTQTSETVETDPEQPPLPPPVKGAKKVVTGTSEDLPPDVDAPAKTTLGASTKPTIKKGKTLVAPPTKDSDKVELHHHDDDEAVK